MGAGSQGGSRGACAVYPDFNDHFLGVMFKSVAKISAPIALPGLGWGWGVEIN